MVVLCDKRPKLIGSPLTRGDAHQNNRHNQDDLELQIKYTGQKLVSSKQYWWKVRILDEKGSEKIINMAKEKIMDTQKSISEIACEPGFKYPNILPRLSKKLLVWRRLITGA